MKTPMKRYSSRSPSPQQRSRPKLQSNSMVHGAVPGSQRKERDAQMSAEDVLTKLKPLNGTAPNFFTASVSDDENGRIYCIQGNGVSNSSELWCLYLGTMEWENIPIHAVVTDVFFPEKLPCRNYPGLALFGPKDHRRLLLFGGQDAAEELSSELFYIDLTTKSFSFISVGRRSIAARVKPSMFLLDDCKLFIFGGLSAYGIRLKTFSLAVFDPLSHLWSWHEQDRQLSSSLGSCRIVMATPVYEGKKILLLSISFGEDKKAVLKDESIFTFDPKSYNAVQDYHAQPGAPSEPFEEIMLRPGPAANEVSMVISRSGERYELWSYRAFPENEWKFLLELTRGPDLQTYPRYVVTCMGQTYILIKDKRGGKKGVNAYIQVDEVVEVYAHSSD